MMALLVPPRMKTAGMGRCMGKPSWVKWHAGFSESGSLRQPPISYPVPDNNAIPASPTEACVCTGAEEEPHDESLFRHRRRHTDLACRRHQSGAELSRRVAAGALALTAVSHWSHSWHRRWLTDLC